VQFFSTDLLTLMQEQKRVSFKSNSMPENIHDQELSAPAVIEFKLSKHVRFCFGDLQVSGIHNLPGPGLIVQHYKCFPANRVLLVQTMVV